MHAHPLQFVEGAWASLVAFLMRLKRFSPAAWLHTHFRFHDIAFDATDCDYAMSVFCFCFSSEGITFCCWVRTTALGISWCFERSLVCSMIIVPSVFDRGWNLYAFIENPRGMVMTPIVYKEYICRLDRIHEIHSLLSYLLPLYYEYI